MNRRITGSVICALTLGFPVGASAQTTNRPGQTRDFVINELSGFNVVLVIGEAQRGRSSTENLPEAAARALKEMGEFLPYKSYRVLDAQWTSCCVPRPSTTVSGRLQGVFEFTSDGKSVPAQASYGYSITAGGSFTNVPMRFVLVADVPGRRAAQGTERELERERQDMQAEMETLASQIRETQRRVEAGVIPAAEVRPLQDRHASLQRRVADLTADLESASHGGGRPIMDSSFTMNAGETVVVGTSKLGGDKALIAVVTAVRKGGASR